MTKPTMGLRMLSGPALLLLLAGAPCAATLVDGPDSLIQVESEDVDRVRLRVRVPESALVVEPRRDGSSGARLATDALGRDPDSPDVPAIVASLGVPEGATLRVEVETLGERRLSGRDPRARPGHGSRKATSRPRAAAHRAEPSRPRDPGPLEIEELRVRGLRVARLTIRPVRREPATGDLWLRDDLRITVEFEGGRGFGAADTGVAGAVGRAAIGRLINRRTVRGERAEAVPGDTRRFARPVRQHGVATGPDLAAFRVRVGEEGLVRVPRDDLVSAGLDAQAVDPRDLRVSYRGVTVPCRVTGEADGSFDAGDAVEFFGRPGDTRFSSDSVYRIEVGTTPGPRFPERPATPGPGPATPSFVDTVRLQEGNRLYTLGNPALEGDPHFFWIWFEDNPYPPRVTTHTSDVTLPGATSGAEAVFRALFLGRTDTAADPDHRIRLSVNGTVVGESAWNGQTFHLAELPFDPALLLPGVNSLRIDALPVTFPDIYFMDWFEVAYPRDTRAASDRLTIVTGGGAETFRVTDLGDDSDPFVVDVTDPLAPVALTGFTTTPGPEPSLTFGGSSDSGTRILVVGDDGRVAPIAIELDTPSNLRDPANAADLLIVTPVGWESALAPLVAHREAQGLRVVVAHLQDVADEFGGGNVDDVAIRDLVAHAYEHWQGPPLSYLLLVGEPSLDPQNWIGSNAHSSHMPSHFTVVASQGETTSDTWFGAVDGADLLPDVAVGRLSVRSAAEAAALVSKIVQYETTAVPGEDWTRRVVQIASNEPGFEASLESAGESLPPGHVIVPEYRSLGATTESIRASIDAGALLVSFMGHGNVSFWADSPGGLFFRAGDADDLSNGERLPFVTTLNCLNGFIADPYTTNSMAEALHNRPTGGALAVWAPSAIGFSSGYHHLQAKLYEKLFEERVRDIGTATLSALVETYLSAPVTLDLVREMTLLGDPSGTLAIECAVSEDDPTCDAVDDDCDGEVDEDWPATPSACGVGACASVGQLACAGGVVIDTCMPGLPAAERCGNGLDDDCDGAIDEGESGVNAAGVPWYRSCARQH